MHSIVHSLYTCTRTHTHTALSPLPSPLVSPSDYPAGTVYSQLSALHNKAELLLLHCQELVEKFDSKMHQLESELSTKNERFLRELDEVEEWLNTAYHLLCQEPSRVIEGAYSLEEEGGRERLESDSSLQFSDPGICVCLYAKFARTCKRYVFGETLLLSFFIFICLSQIFQEIC